MDKTHIIGLWTHLPMNEKAPYVQLGRAQPRVTKFLIHLPELKSRQCVARMTRILGPTGSLDSKTSPQNHLDALFIERPKTTPGKEHSTMRSLRNLQPD